MYIRVCKIGTQCPHTSILPLWPLKLSSPQSTRGWPLNRDPNHPWDSLFYLLLFYAKDGDFVKVRAILLLCERVRVTLLMCHPTLRIILFFSSFTSILLGPDKSTIRPSVLRSSNMTGSPVRIHSGCYEQTRVVNRGERVKDRRGSPTVHRPLLYWPSPLHGDW